ncbi:unnamed protein product [Dicrocoelium dendriticum]|nr:unnamed protein product [Dicrocoelium dendriticum]
MLLEPLSDDSSTFLNHPLSRTQLINRCVRGFLAGSTNPLLRSNRQLVDVLVSSLSPMTGLPESAKSTPSILTSVFGLSHHTIGVHDSDASSPLTTLSTVGLGTRSPNLFRPFFTVS